MRDISPAEIEQCQGGFVFTAIGIFATSLLATLGKRAGDDLYDSYKKHHDHHNPEDTIEEEELA